ncbi:MAG: DHHA1 domain-containing protein, partial [bacterium]
GYTGQRAIEYLLLQETAVQRLAQELRTKRDLDELLAGVERLRDEAKGLRDEVAKMKEAMALAQVDGLIGEGARVGDTLVLAADLPGQSAETLRTLAGAIKDREPSHAILLIGGEEGKYATLVACSPDQIAKGLKAGELIGQVGKLLGAGGGGRPDLAQGGGKDGNQIPAALQLFREKVGV